MSLDTVLKIGKAFRNSENNFQYFENIKQCPKDQQGEYPFSISIPINPDFSFNLEGVKKTPENKQNDLYYLKYKTSSSDTSVKYIFGDIYYGKKYSIAKNKTITAKEIGFYRLLKQSSFKRGEESYLELIQYAKREGGSIKCLEKFHDEFEKNIISVERILNFIPAIYYYFNEEQNFSFSQLLEDEDLLEELSIKQNYQLISKQNLKKIGITTTEELFDLTDKQKALLFKCSNLSIFIHFEFPNNKHWYNFSEDMEVIRLKLLSSYVDDFENNGFVLKKTIYKTLCSGDKDNDIQFPNFLVSNKHKSKLFNKDTLLDLFYALNFTKMGKLVSKTDVKLITLPCGEHLEAKHYKEFFEKRNEAKIKTQNVEQDVEEPLFDFSNDNETNITSFDLIFCKQGGVSAPDKDLIELSGIEKSKLRQTKERIEKISNKIYDEKIKALNTTKKIRKLYIENSLLNILGYHKTTAGGKIEASPKYKAHILKVVPLIYTDNYYQDKILLPAFIQNIECSIRAGYNNFNFLKYDLKFLLEIQNSEKDGFMKIIESKSYEVGLLLGELARNLSQNINSFEKNYVGNLTRRLSNLTDFVKLKNDIEQKLVMHDKTKFTFQTSYTLSQKIKEFQSSYDKEECAFGFMESYFKPLPKKVQAD